jgi:hypothetical protein
MVSRWVTVPRLPEYANSTRARDFYHLLYVGEEVAVRVYWIGGRAERPNEWVVRVVSKPQIHISCSTLDEARQIAEEELDPESQPKIFEATIDQPVWVRPEGVPGTYLGTIPYDRDGQADVYTGSGDVITLVFSDTEHSEDDYNIDVITYLAKSAGTPYAQRILAMLSKR